MLGSLFRRVAGSALRLPPAKNAIDVEKGLQMRTRDGVALVADRYYPKDGKPRPTVLVRTPYGRGAIMSFSAALLAERGLNVVVQSVRGTTGSQGVFDPIRQERADGVDTVDWVRAQSWFGGKLYLFGGSYLGCAAWAIATEAPEKIDGAALTVTLSNFRDELIEFGGLTQMTALGWSKMMHALTSTGKSPFFGGKPVDVAAHMHLPVGALDQAVSGATVSWWQDWVRRRDPSDPWWEGMNFSPGVTAMQAPTLLIAGWQDLFLPYELKDFAARQAMGLATWITIGPWEHGGPGGLFEGQRQCVEFLAALGEGRNVLETRAPVRLFVQGADAWRDYDQWPPADAAPFQLHLRGEGRLDFARADDVEKSARYDFDPADPTPSIYGATTAPGKTRDVSALEQRKDVVSFTTSPLDSALEIIGPVAAQLCVRSNREHTDFYVCLADVDEQGRSMHVTDGYIRLTPAQFPPDADGVRRVEIECWPTAYRFVKGRRLRLFVASASFPRYARNLGTGEPMAEATRMVVAEQEIMLGGAHASCINVLRMRDA